MWGRDKEHTCFNYYQETHCDKDYYVSSRYKILTAAYVLSALRPIKVGATYKNSAGKICTIKEVLGYDVWYYNEDDKI